MRRTFNRQTDTKNEKNTEDEHEKNSRRTEGKDSMDRTRWHKPS